MASRNQPQPHGSDGDAQATIKRKLYDIEAAPQNEPVAISQALTEPR